MALRIKITIFVMAVACLASFFVFALPSLIGFLLTGLTVLTIFQFFQRRKQHAYSTFNSALRAVCHRDGGVARVATAFARSGPLRGPCYEYARRLMVGQDAIEAAADARVPLQLATAVAMQSAPPQGARECDVYQREAQLRGDQAGDVASAYSQILYLTVTGAVTCAVLTYVTIKIVPQIEKLSLELAATENPYEWLFAGTSPTWILLGAMGLLLLYVMTTLTQSGLASLRWTRWMPVSPRAAESKADMLRGLADAIDAGMPLPESLQLASRISLNPAEQAALRQAAVLLQSGVPAAEALLQAGQVDAQQSGWLRDAEPTRFAQLLRHFADNQIRDAQANVRWLMGILFPLLVLLMGTAVLAYAYGFFGMLMGLIRGMPWK
jgi:hypothetical protein